MFEDHHRLGRYDKPALRNESTACGFTPRSRHAIRVRQLSLAKTPHAALAQAALRSGNFLLKIIQLVPSNLSFTLPSTTILAFSFKLLKNSSSIPNHGGC